MKSIFVLIVCSSFIVGCAGLRTQRPQGAVAAANHGTLLTQGPAVKAVVVGPVALHAYSAFSGGALFVADATTGTDSDCLAADRAATNEVLRADRVLQVDVSKGKVACLTTARAHAYELVWHVRRDDEGARLVLAARTH